MEFKKVERKKDLSKKGKDSWNQAMSFEGGQLAIYTDEILKMINENFESKIESLFKNKLLVDVEISKSINVAAHQFPRIHFQENTKSYTISNDFTSSRLNVRDYEVAKPFLISKVLFVLLMQKHFNDIKNKGINNRLINIGGLDLSDNSKINIDNAQTILDTANLILPNAKSAEDAVYRFERMVNEGPSEFIKIGDENIRINPQRMSYIELLGYAPFGTLAYFRNYAPVSVDREKIVDTNGKILSDEFIHMLTRAKINELQFEKINSREIRHGGCPVHYPEYRNMHLIQKFAETYLRIIKYYMQNQDKFNIRERY